MKEEPTCRMCGTVELVHRYTAIEMYHVYTGGGRYEEGIPRGPELVDKIVFCDVCWREIEEFIRVNQHSKGYHKILYERLTEEPREEPTYIDGPNDDVPFEGWQDESRTETATEQIYETRYDCPSVPEGVRPRGRV